MGQDQSKAEALNSKLRKELEKGFMPAPAKLLGISKFNILVLGEVGSGKSAAINTIRTALHPGDNLHEAALALGGQGNVTTFYERYRLSPKAGVYLCDTWGIYQGKNYVDDGLRMMLEGRLERETAEVEGSIKRTAKDSNPISSLPNVTYREASCTEEERKSREIHMVVFCVRADKPFAQTSSSPADFDILVKMGELIKDIHQSKGIISAVLMTCTDKIDEKVSECETPYDILHHPKVQERLKSVSDSTGVSQQRILPMIAYWKFWERDHLIDSNALSVLKTLMNMAEGFLSHKLSYR